MADVVEQVAGTTEGAGVQGAAASILALGRPLHLRLVALVLDNFKSFRMKTRIPLQEGFTTVSGPNGSGKSNVIDALQFVMGTATSKGMRAERLSDLICSDSGKPSARVTLELEGTFRRADEGLFARTIELTRVVRKSKSGPVAHYELDGEAVRLVDLHEVLRELGFPTSGQNIVMQGDVARVTSMGGVARRQILDELAGAREFDRRIALAHEELEAADRCTEDTKLILKELAQRLGQLQRERDQALKFQSLSARQASLEENLVVLDVTDAELKVRAHEQSRVEGEKQHKQLERKLSELRAIGEEKQGQLGAIEAELAEKGEGERLTALRAVESLKARLEGGRRQQEQDRAERAERESKLPALVQAAEKAEARLGELGAHVETLAGELREREQKHQALAGRFEAQSEALFQHSAAQVEAAQKGRQLRLEAEVTRQRERELAERERSLAEEISRKQAEAGHLEGALGELRQRREELAGRAREANERHRGLRQAAGEAFERRRQLQIQLGGLRAGLESVQQKLGRAEREVAIAEDRRQQAMILSGGQALAFLRQRGLAGLHGPVTDLIKFEGAHALALEAAGGGRLHWVVVDDERVAKSGIELLRRHDAGRLTFAPLTKIQAPRPEGELPRGKSIVGWAMDLVSAERRYQKVLEAVFGWTLVVDCMEAALPLIGRYRIVTLDGDVMERVGTMSGGAASKGSRVLQAAVRASEEVEERKRGVTELERQCSAARGELRRVEEQLEQAADEVTRCQSELAEAETTCAALNGELSRLEQQERPQAERLATLQRELEALLAEQARVVEALRALRGELDGREAGMLDLGAPDAGEAFEALSTKTKELEAQLRGLEGELGQLRQRHAEAEAERRAAAERLTAARQAVEEARAALLALATRLERGEAELRGVEDELRRSEAALKALSSELVALTQRRDAARVALDQARDAVRAAELEQRTLAGRLEQLDKELLELRQAAEALRAAAVARGVEVPPVEEAPPDTSATRKRVERSLDEVTRELEALGPVNQLAIQQFEDCQQRHGELAGKVEALETEKSEIRARIVGLEGKKKQAFLDAFALVAEAFEHTFAELARGEGRLRLEEPKDPFAGGLIIEARPRGKKLSRLEVMSGGEKTLTALAFIFALQEVNPAPFFVFDEVDAALDGVNTEVLAEAVARRGSDRQYLVISHHRVMLDKSRQTLGVTMRKGWGTVVSGVAMEEQPSEPAAAVAEVGA